jgi:hypothetical protein
MAVGGSIALWRNVMIGKFCALENKMANIQHNHAGNYATMEKCMENMDISISIMSACPFSAQL